MKQLSLIPKPKLFYGGEISAGKRKTARPIDARKSLHLVLKAKKKYDLFANRQELRNLTEKYAKRFGINIYKLSFQHDHVHILIRVHDRPSYVRFIRALTGQMARLLGKGLFRFLPFSRVVHWGKAFKIAQNYVDQNENEVYGLQPYKPRKDYYAKFYKDSA